MTKEKKSSYIFYLTVFLGCFLGTLLFLFCFFVIFSTSFQESISSINGVFFGTSKQSLSPSERFHLIELIDNGHVIRAESIISDLSSYYESVINILVTLVGILGVIAFMYVKAFSTEKAEEASKMAAEKTATTYLESKRFNDENIKYIDESLKSVKSSLKQLYEDSTSKFEDIDDIETKFNELIMRIENIESKLAESDDADEEGEEMNLQA